jgi:hypothetical protein
MTFSEWWAVVRDLPWLMSEPFLFTFPLWMYVGASIALLVLLVLVLYTWRDLDPVMSAAKMLFIFSAGNLSTVVILIYGFEMELPGPVLAWSVIILIFTILAGILGYTPFLDRVENRVLTTVDMTRKQRKHRRDIIKQHSGGSSPRAVSATIRGQ